MKLLHIAPDEKFIPFIQEAFSEISGNNRYCIYGVAPSQSPRFVAVSDDTKFITDAYWFSSASMRSDLEWCDCLIVHYMHAYVARAVLSCPKRVVVIWSAWGGDYSRYIESQSGNLVTSATARLRTTSASGRNLFRQLAKKALYATIFGYWEKKAIRRVNFFSAPIPEEYDTLKIVLPELSAKYLQLNYVDMGEITVERTSTAARDILLGNSATPTNNHVEVLNLLKRADLGGRRIIAPLSYGDMQYADEVAKIGKRMFGNNFFPLLKMMPLDEYRKVISSCSTVFMNHRRIQGGGNIVCVLAAGAKLYLNPDNQFLAFFQKRGAAVFGMPTADSLIQDIFSPLSEEEKQRNSVVLEEFWGRERVVSNVRKLVATVSETIGDRKS